MGLGAPAPNWLNRAGSLVMVDRPALMRFHARGRAANWSAQLQRYVNTKFEWTLALRHFDIIAKEYFSAATAKRGVVLRFARFTLAAQSQSGDARSAELSLG